MDRSRNDKMNDGYSAAVLTVGSTSVYMKHQIAIVVGLAGLFLAAVVAFAVWHRTEQPHFVISQRKIKSYMKATEIAVDRYVARNGGSLPSSIAELMTQIYESPSSDPEFPLPNHKGWITEIKVKSKMEAIASAAEAPVGSVIFCPLEVNHRIAGYFILGKDDNGVLAKGLKGPMILCPSDSGLIGE